MGNQDLAEIVAGKPFDYIDLIELAKEVEDLSRRVKALTQRKTKTE